MRKPSNNRTTIPVDILKDYATGTLSSTANDAVTLGLLDSPEDLEVLAGIQAFMEDHKDHDQVAAKLLDDLDDAIDNLLDAYIDDEKGFDGEFDLDDQAIVFDHALQAQQNLAETYEPLPKVQFIVPPNQQGYLLRSDQNEMQLFEVSDKVIAQSWTSPMEIKQAMFSPTADYLAWIGGDHTVRIADKNDTFYKVLIHDHQVSYLNISYQNDYILSIADKQVQLWNFRGNHLTEFQHDHTPSWTGFSWSDQNILSSTESGELFIWDLPGILLQQIQHPYPIKWANIHPHSNFIFSLDDHNNLYYRDSNGNLLWRKENVSSLLPIPDSANFLILYKDKSLAVIDSFGRKIGTIPDHRKFIAAYPSAEGNHILSISDEGFGQIMDVSGKIIQSLDCEFALKQALWSPDGKQILALGVENQTMLFKKDQSGHFT